MVDMDNELKTSLTGSVPQELVSELRLMRQNPDNFYLRGRSCCLFCGGTGQKNAYQLGHPKSIEAGTWCPEHGWLSFDSPQLPPTEPRRSK